MSTFRNAQLQAHPTKTNTILVAVISILILIVTMQTWLLTSALNTSLEGGSMKWPAFWASLALFLSGAILLRFLPHPIRMPAGAVVVEAFPRSALAWRTLAISVGALGLSFAVWFMWSAIPLRLNDAGFNLNRQHLFWLTSTPVVLGSLLRIPYGTLVTSFGSRRSYAWVTLALALPCIATGFAVRDPNTPYWVLLCCSALTGIAGANFATSMAVINLWFPKQAQGTALGINGLGNLGVTVAQFAIPAVVGMSLLGGAGDGTGGTTLNLENAAFIWLPFILLATAAIWFFTEDFPTQPRSLASQYSVAKEPQVWVLSFLYFLTFGCFVAMGASLPLIIREVFADAPGGPPTPLHYAPWAAAIATVARPLGGYLADRFGAGVITSLSTACMAIGGFSLSAFLEPHDFAGFFTLILFICAAAGMGNGSIFKAIPMVLPRRAGAAIGLVSCVGALGGFFPPLILGMTIDRFGGPAWAYTGMALFALVCLCMNFWCYQRATSPSRC